MRVGHADTANSVIPACASVASSCPGRNAANTLSPIPTTVGESSLFLPSLWEGRRGSEKKFWRFPEVRGLVEKRVDEAATRTLFLRGPSPQRPTVSRKGFAKEGGGGDLLHS